MDTKANIDSNAQRYGSTQAASYIGVNGRELKSLRLAKRLPFYRIGHRTIVFDKADLDAFLASCRVEAA